MTALLNNMTLLENQDMISEEQCLQILVGNHYGSDASAREEIAQFLTDFTSCLHI